MATKPILFSTPMVQAILDGRKTMTRRIINPKLIKDWAGAGFAEQFINWTNHNAPHQPGDILWVRETWAPASQNRYILRADYRDEKTMIPYEQCGMNVEVSLVRFHPSIFMPKSACRLFLRVTDVRAERLQEITYDDCLREGMWNKGTDVNTLASFQELWQHLNAKRGYGWGTNPWVWVYTFERCDRPEGWSRMEGATCTNA